MAPRRDDDEDLPQWVQLVVLILGTLAPLALAVWLVSRFAQ